MIEGPTAVVIFDGQLLLPYAEEVASYVQTLGKPVDRIILSHAHTDHWSGLQVLTERFPDARVFALDGVADQLRARGPARLDSLRRVYGDRIATKVTVPTETITEGLQRIDGITYDFKRFVDAESDLQLAALLPEQKVLREHAEELLQAGMISARTKAALAELGCWPPDLKPTVAGFVGLCSVLHRLAPQRFAINAPSRSVSGECQCIPLPSAEPPRTDCARREQLRQAPYQRRCRTWEVRDTLLLAAGERRISLRSEMMPESLLAAPVSVPGCEFRDAYLSRYLVASRGAS
jgi:hypothetical protein